jgi:RNA polymerase sigma-70 factor (ECF subfamily)
MLDTAQTRFERLFEQFETPVRNYCARRIHESLVDDAVNDTFAVVWRKIDQAPVGDAALPWIYGVAYREVQHAWRANGRTARLQSRLEGVLDRPAHSLEDGLVESDDRRRVLEAAGRLAGADQEILRLTLWEELSAADVATALGVTVEAARQRASRARSRLAAEFRRVEDHPNTVDRPNIWAPVSGKET